MRTYSFLTVDVFTTQRFGGNPLAVFPDAQGLSDDEMRALAAEVNYSETSFVLPADDPSNTARVRIFNRTAELPFAGHPNIGTAYVLASLGRTEPVLRFEEIAGIVQVQVERGRDGEVIGATIDAPQPLQTQEEFSAAEIAACLGISAEHVVTATHKPVRASVGVDFVLAEVTRDALPCASPDKAAFVRVADAHRALGERLSIFVYAREQRSIRSRMFAPLAGTWEDPATGSANAALAALLLLTSERDEAAYDSVQGVEMGRPSYLQMFARRASDGVHAQVGGRCVPVFRGEVEL